MITQRVHDASERHPEWWVAAVSAGAWIAMATGAPTALASIGHDHAAPLRSLDAWLIMVFAMMVTLSLPTVRGVARASLWPRRHRAMIAFLAGFSATWTAAGLVLLEVHHAAVALLGPVAVAAAALVGAAAWSRCDRSRRAVSRCRATTPLAPRGWRADCDAVRFGTRIGWSCVVSCWATMAAVVALGHHVAVMSAALAIELRRRV